MNKNCLHGSQESRLSREVSLCTQAVATTQTASKNNNSFSAVKPEFDELIAEYRSYSISMAQLRLIEENKEECISLLVSYGLRRSDAEEIFQIYSITLSQRGFGWIYDPNTRFLARLGVITLGPEENLRILKSRLHLQVSAYFKYFKRKKRDISMVTSLDENEWSDFEDHGVKQPDKQASDTDDLQELLHLVEPRLGKRHRILLRNAVAHPEAQLHRDDVYEAMSDDDLNSFFETKGKTKQDAQNNEPSTSSEEVRKRAIASRATELPAKIQEFALKNPELYSEWTSRFD